MTKKKRYRLAVNLLVALVPTVVLLSVIEAVCRGIIKSAPDRARSGFVVSDPDLVWRLKENKDGMFKTNSIGFRDFPLVPDADVRVLVLGDSVTWGDGITRPDFLYTTVLEESLNKSGEVGKVDIINTGVPGYSTYQERLYLELKGMALKPDLIVLQFCLNDVFEPFLTIAEKGGDRNFLGVDTRVAAKGIFGWLLQHSVAFESLVRFLQNRARNKEEYDVRKMTSTELSPELEEAWKEVTEEILKIKMIANEARLPLLLSIMPYRFQLENPVKSRKPQDMLVALARKHRIAYLDLLPVFSDVHKHAPDLELFHDANHLSIAGHKLTANALQKSTLMLIKAKQKLNAFQD